MDCVFSRAGRFIVRLTSNACKKEGTHREMSFEYYPVRIAVDSGRIIAYVAMTDGIRSHFVTIASKMNGDVCIGEVPIAKAICEDAVNNAAPADITKELVVIDHGNSQGHLLIKNLADHLENGALLDDDWLESGNWMESFKSMIWAAQ